MCHPVPLRILSPFVGFHLRGLLGARVAAIGVFLPPVLMIVLLTPFYQDIKEAGWMRPVSKGLLAGLLGFLALAAAQMGRAAVP